MSVLLSHGCDNYRPSHHHAKTTRQPTGHVAPVALGPMRLRRSPAYCRFRALRFLTGRGIVSCAMSRLQKFWSAISDGLPVLQTENSTHTVEFVQEHSMITGQVAFEVLQRPSRFQECLRP